MSQICVFDLDGTLVDSMNYFGNAMLSVLDDAGIKYGDDLVNYVTPLGYEKTAEYYIELGVKKSVDEIVSIMKERLVYEYTNNIKLKKGVQKFLEKKHKEGARLFVLTASPHIVTDVCLKNNGVYELFEKIWSVDDFGMPKTNIGLFSEVAKTIGCECAQINYFEDNLTAVKNALKAGYKVYGVKDKQSESDINEIKNISSVFVNTFEELV